MGPERVGAVPGDYDRRLGLVLGAGRSAPGSSRTGLAFGDLDKLFAISIVVVIPVLLMAAAAAALLVFRVGLLVVVVMLLELMVKFEISGVKRGR